MTLAARFDQALVAARAKQPFEKLCVAVSGGSDSMALLHLAAAWAAKAGVALSAVTVDHGLRAAAAHEATQVGAVCAGLGVPHATLRWSGYDGRGNTQAEARTARYALIAKHVGTECPVLIAHTRDDQAETFMMRLARGSGVDGLAAMRVDWMADGARWLRPCLNMERGELREWLTERGVAWIDDPTNDDVSYDRVRMRQARPVLDDLGLTLGRLDDTAARMAEASEALRWLAHDRACHLAREDQGDVVFDADGLAALPTETRFRLLAHGLRWVACATYRPRLSALIDLWAGLATDTRRTLAGCLVTRKGAEVRITREVQGVLGVTAVPNAVWDQRWQLLLEVDQGFVNTLIVKALGEGGLAYCPNWRETGLPRASILSSPALWDGENLVSAPLAGHPNGWSAQVIHPWGDFRSSLLSH